MNLSNTERSQVSNSVIFIEKIKKARIQFSLFFFKHCDL